MRPRHVVRRVAWAGADPDPWPRALHAGPRGRAAPDGAHSRKTGPDGSADLAHAAAREPDASGVRSDAVSRGRRTGRWRAVCRNTEERWTVVPVDRHRHRPGRGARRVAGRAVPAADGDR